MATLATNVSFQCFGLDGKPLAGGKVYTYSAGTTTNKATYTTMAGTVPNSNPVILDQNGKAKIFLGDGAYRMRILDSNDALIDDIDQISRYVTQSEFASFQQTVNDGVSQLTEVREQINVFVNTSIGNQKGFANGIAPLDVNAKVDPIYLPTLINTPLVPKATETALGVAKIATTAIAQAGADDTDFLTAKKLRDALNAGGVLPVYGLRSWGIIKGTTTPASLGKGVNVASIVDEGVGQYKVTFITAMPNIDYVILTGTTSYSTGDLGTYGAVKMGSKTVNGFSIVCGAQNYTDIPEIYFGVTY